MPRHPATNRGALRSKEKRRGKKKKKEKKNKQDLDTNQGSMVLALTSVNVGFHPTLTAAFGNPKGQPTSRTAGQASRSSRQDAASKAGLYDGRRSTLSHTQYAVTSRFPQAPAPFYQDTEPSYRPPRPLAISSPEDNRLSYRSGRCAYGAIRVIVRNLAVCSTGIGSHTTPRISMTPAQSVSPPSIRLYRPDAAGSLPGKSA